MDTKQQRKNLRAPILKRRNLSNLTQRHPLNSHIYESVTKFSSPPEGSLAADFEEKEPCDSFCTLGGDSKHSVQIPEKRRPLKTVRFVSDTKFFERNPKSKFWRDMEKRRRTSQDIESLLNLRMKHTSSFQTLGACQQVPLDVEDTHFYYPHKNTTRVPAHMQQSPGVCCLEVISRRIRDFVRCKSKERESPNPERERLTQYRRQIQYY